MQRSSSRSSCNDKKSRARSEDYRSRTYRARNGEELDRKRQAWKIQQERERQHELLKKKMILQYELDRQEKNRLKECSGRSSYRSRSSSRDRTSSHQSRDRSRHSPEPAIMSHKLESADGSTPLFKGPPGTKYSPSELHRIKVDLHRNIPGTSVSSSDIERDIVNPEEIALKRREDEGIKPIFDREELKLQESSSIIEEVEECRVVSSLKTEKSDEGKKPIFDRDELKLAERSIAIEEVAEHRTVKTIGTERSERRAHSSKRRSRSLSSGRHDKSSQETSSSRSLRRERSIHCLYRKNNRRSYSSERDNGHRRSRSRENERRDRLRNHPKYASSHDIDRREHSSRRRSSRERSYSEDRKRRTSGYDRPSRSERSGHSHREYRGRSRERRERQRSPENRGQERSIDRRISTMPHYIEPVPVPVYYGNFPPRPVMMGPMMPIRGPMMRNRLPVGPRVPFAPRFMHPDMYRQPNPRFNRMF